LALPVVRFADRPWRSSKPSFQALGTCKRSARIGLAMCRVYNQFDNEELNGKLVAVKK
jgi:hypothetical protein